MARAVQLNLGGTINRSDKAARPPKRSEGALQQQTRATLGNLGYASMEAGATRKQVCCPNCAHKFFPTGWQGNSVGLPDLSVFRYHDAFPGVAIWIELKGDGTKVSPEQQALADQGRSVIARSIGEAVEAVLKVEAALDAYRFDPRKREQLERFLSDNAGHLW